MEQFDEIQIPEIEEKSRKRKIAGIIGIAGGSVVLFAIIIIFMVKLLSREESALLKGIRNLAEEVAVRQELWEAAGGYTSSDGFDNIKTTTVFNLSSDELPITLGIDTVLLQDAEKRKLRASTEFSVMNNRLAEMDIYGEEDTIVVALPDFWKQNLAFGTERIDEQYNNSLLAEKFGRLEMQDISIELFPEREYFSWQDSIAFWQAEIENAFHSDKRSDSDKDGNDSEEELARISIEKLEEPIEISIPEKEKQYQCSQYRVVIPDGWIKLNTQVDITQDMELLIAIDENDRIVQISLEEPVCFSVESEGNELDVYCTGKICFLGEDRSIDDIVVSMQMETAIEALELDESVLSAFGNKLDEEEKIEIQTVAEILYDENDTCVTANLNKMTAEVDRIGSFKLTGTMTAKPLQEEIEPLSGETIRIFGMTEEEYQDLEGQLRQKIWLWRKAFSIFG